MAKLQMTVPHGLSGDDALKRIKTLLQGAKKDHSDQISNVKETWTGNRGEFSFTAMGVAVSGHLLVKPNEVELVGEVPWILRARIEGMVREKANQLLSR